MKTVLFSICFFSLTIAYGQLELVNELNTGGNSTYYDNNNGNRDSYAIYKDKIYYSLRNLLTNTYQLWKTDGTTAGSSLVLDFGQHYDECFGFTVFKDLLYFTADSFNISRGVFVSDGTSAGTHLFHKSIMDGALPKILFKNDNYLFYELNENGPNFKYPIFVTDGSIKYILKDSANSVSAFYGGIPSRTIGSKSCFFEGDKNMVYTDGTINGTRVYTIKYPLTPLVGFENEFYCAAALDSDIGYELYKLTKNGVELEKDIYPGFIGGLYADPMANVNGRIVLLANVQGETEDVHSYNPETKEIELLKVVKPDIKIAKFVTDVTSNESKNPALINGYLYFYSNTPDLGIELWRTDGTPNGTTFIKDINDGEEDCWTNSFVSIFTGKNGLVYFQAISQEYGNEIWESDGTSKGTHLLQDLSLGDHSFFYEIFPFHNKLMVVALNNTNGRELWSYTPSLKPLEVDIKKRSDISCDGKKNGALKVDILGGQEPYEILWSNGVSNEYLIRDLTKGAYSVTVVDANGEKQVANAMIEDAKPIIFTAEVKDASQGQKNGSITIHVTQGLYPFKFTWVGNKYNDTIINNLGPNFYSCIITDANGCTVSSNIEVKESTSTKDIPESELVQIKVNHNYLLVESTETALLRIFDLNGKELFQSNIIKGNNTIKIPEIQYSQLLLCNVITKNGKSYTKQFYLQH